jgi:hypothetical protein
VAAALEWLWRSVLNSFEVLGILTDLESLPVAQMREEAVKGGVDSINGARCS